MELSPEQTHHLKKLLKAINKWRVAGQNNQENSEAALSLGVKAMKSITNNLELLMACFDKFGGGLQTRNTLNQHLAMIEGMRNNNDLDFENMGGCYDYQSFTQDYFTSALETWIWRTIEHVEGSDKEYSLPLSMTKWAFVFGVSRNKMREFRDNKQYHFRQVSPRKWSLPKKELPAEYLEKYRITTHSKSS